MRRLLPAIVGMLKRRRLARDRLSPTLRNHESNSEPRDGNSAPPGQSVGHAGDGATARKIRIDGLRFESWAAVRRELSMEHFRLAQRGVAAPAETCGTGCPHSRSLPGSNFLGRNQMVKLFATVCLLGLGSSIAAAQQQTPPPPPVGPSAADCQQGWKDGSRWTQEQFVAACAKLREGQKN